MTAHKKNRRYSIIFQVLAASLILSAVALIEMPGQISATVEDDLGAHMFIEHSVFFLLGYFVMIYINKLYVGNFSIPTNPVPLTNMLVSKRRKRLGWICLKKMRLLWLSAILALLFFWHVPIIFDFAYYDDLVHFLQHFSFIVVGMCIFLVMGKFDFSFLLFLFVLMGGLMGLCGLLLTVSYQPLYSPYTLQSHANAGNYMIVSSIFLMIVVMPMILIRKAIFVINGGSVDKKD